MGSSFKREKAFQNLTFSFTSFLKHSMVWSFGLQLVVMSSRSVDQNKFEATKKSVRNNADRLKRTLLNSSSEVVRSMSPKNHLVTPLSFFFVIQEGKAFVTIQRSKQVALSMQNTLINTTGMRRPRDVTRDGNAAHKKGYTYCFMIANSGLQNFLIDKPSLPGTTWDLVSVWFRGTPFEFQTIHFTQTAENILSYGYPRYLSNTV